MRKLKTTEIKLFREEQLKKQNGVCPLCEHIIDPKDAVLDHKHDGGKIRQVLHRFCNTFLGKIENNVKRNAITPNKLYNILKNYIEYVENTQDILHPTHRTAEEKLERAKKRAKARRKRAKGVDNK